MTEVSTLYRMYDADDQLLYVGTSKRPLDRFEEHRQEKVDWSLVSKITTQHFKTRQEADNEEQRVIPIEKPRWNVVGINRPSKPQKPSTPKKPRKKWINGNRRIMSREEIERQRLHASQYGIMDASRGVRFPQMADLFIQPVINSLPFYENKYEENSSEFILDLIDLLKLNDAFDDDWFVNWYVVARFEDGECRCIGGVPSEFTSDHQHDNDLLKKYSHPYSTSFGFAKWDKLPFHMGRYEGFYRQLRWKPQPLEPMVPLRKLLSRWRVKQWLTLR